MHDGGRYLISADSYHKAVQMAIDRGISVTNILYIPTDGYRRSLRLERVDTCPSKFLIGEFSDEERDMLAGNRR